MVRAAVRTILAVPPPAPSLVPVYKTTLTTTTNENTTTWSSVDIGTPHPKRIVILGIFGGINASITATVDGIPSFLGTSVSSTNGFRREGSAVAACQVPNNTTAEIVVTAASSPRKAVSVYVAYPGSHAPADWGTQSSTTTTDANIANLKAPAGGFLIYAGAQIAALGTFATTWNGTNGTLTENVDAQLEATSSYTAGMIDLFSRSSDLDDLNMAESTSGTKQLVAVTWGPAWGGYV